MKRSSWTNTYIPRKRISTWPQNQILFMTPSYINFVIPSSRFSHHSGRFIHSFVEIRHSMLANSYNCSFAPYKDIWKQTLHSSWSWTPIDFVPTASQCFLILGANFRIPIPIRKSADGNGPSHRLCFRWSVRQEREFLCCSLCWISLHCFSTEISWTELYKKQRNNTTTNGWC